MSMTLLRKAKHGVVAWRGTIKLLLDIFFLFVKYCAMLRNTFIGVSGALLTQYAAGFSASCASAKANANTVDRPKPAIKPVCLKDRTVLITGATAGIGLACTWRFAGKTNVTTYHHCVLGVKLHTVCN